jgi:hypothetical protein
VASYARVATQEPPPAADLADFWAPPASFFIAPGALLRETVEDLEWPHGDAELALRRHPRRLRLAAAGGGLALAVELPPEALSGFEATAPEVKSRFAYKLLRVAFANVPTGAGGRGGGGGGGGAPGGGVSTKVEVDAEGALKVTHMLQLPGGPRDAPAATATHPLAGDAAAAAGGGPASRVAVAQFVLLPVGAGSDEDEGEGAGGEGAAPAALEGAEEARRAASETARVYSDFEDD